MDKPTTCDGCSRCCMQEGLLILAEFLEYRGKDNARLPPELQNELNHAKRANYTGPCLWLDREKRRCKHHAHRPLICRDYQLGGFACLEARANVTEADYEATCGL